MVHCPACDRDVPAFRVAPSFCPECYQDGMSALTKVWLESGSKQEKDRILENLKSLKNVRRPLWITMVTDASPKQVQDAWEQAIDGAIAMVEQSV